MKMLLPLLQAQRYAALKKPYLINDMVMQDVLLDRRKVYAKLQASPPIRGILQPAQAVMWDLCCLHLRKQHSVTLQCCLL